MAMLPMLQLWKWKKNTANIMAAKAEEKGTVICNHVGIHFSHSFTVSVSAIFHIFT